MRVVARDGRSFLRETDKTYDLVMVDAYRGTFVPFHLLTKEFFTLLKSRLKPAAVAAQNIERARCSMIQRSRTLKAVFDQVEIYEAGRNVVAIAYDGAVKRVQSWRTGWARCRQNTIFAIRCPICWISAGLSPALPPKC